MNEAFPPRKPVRTRPRWRIGELTGAEAALAAGADVSPAFSRIDHYDPASRCVCITRATALGSSLTDLARAVHEAMHARQWSESSISSAFHRAGILTRWPWYFLAGGMLVGAFTGHLALAAWCLGGMFALSLFKLGVILNLETEAWDMTKVWFAKNYIMSQHEWLELREIAKNATQSYIHGAFRPR
jgi:Zn-dependent membrane protease YugP